MKKSLIALALMGAFSGAAFAQSNVTLYGILDVNLQRNDPEVGEATTGVNSGHQSGSRWGVRGSEALGGGMSAIFTLEGGYNVDDGMMGQGGRLFGRQAWAGLQWDAAKVALVAGRLATFSSGTGSFDFFGQVDPFLTGFGDSSLGSTFTSAGALRVDNTVALVGGPWAGFRAGVAYSFNVSGQEQAGSSNNNSAIATGLAWSGGPFMVGVTYDIIDVDQRGLGVIPAGAPDQKHLQVGGTFDLKFVKLHAAYAQEDNVYFTSGIGLNSDAGADADAWMLGVTVPLFGGQLLGSYQDRNGDPITLTVAGTPVQRERDVTVWAIGYTYPLSRRTNVYANYSDRDLEGPGAQGTANDRSQMTL
ncbi:MAG: porin, partial [Burkholderiaceae bacterium]